MDVGCTCEYCELRELLVDNLDSENLKLVCSGKYEKSYKAGEVIIREGTRIQDFTYLKSGLVKLFKNDSTGREQIITIARPMDYVSLLSVFSGDNYNYSVTALEDSVTCNLKMDEIKMLAITNGELSYNLLRQMSAIADTIILESLEIRKKHLRGRVAYLLIYFSQTVFNSMEFDLPLSRKEMADYVGMTTENVIRTLSEFRKDGILKIYGKTIQIISMDTLRSIAEFG
jgi:CRP-like cAMP-binding protein